MKPNPEAVSESPNENRPLSESEVYELSSSLRKLAFEGVPIPKHLLRDFRTDDIHTYRRRGHTLDAVPLALDRLGADRDVVASNKQFATIMIR